MQKPMKIVSMGKASLEVSKNAGTFAHIAMWLSRQRILPFEMFSHGVPFEANRTYNAMRSEFECRRAIAQFEIQRQTLRGL